MSPESHRASARSAWLGGYYFRAPRQNNCCASERWGTAKDATRDPSHKFRLKTPREHVIPIPMNTAPPNRLFANRIAAVSPRSALAKLDGRTREARLVRDTRAALTAHVGGAPSATERVLIDRACQLTLRIVAMDRQFAETGAMSEHASRTYLAWSNSLTRTLREIGFKSAPPPRKTLADLSWPAAGRAA